MNGLPSTNPANDLAHKEDDANENLRSLLERVSRDHKIIYGAIRGVFDLNRSHIENFVHLLNQRVEEQQGQCTSHCEICVYYNNGTSRRISGFEQFSNFTETANRFPTVITLHLSYFVKFPASDAPEKQSIDILIRSSESSMETLDMVMNDTEIRVSGDRIQVAAPSGHSDFGIMSYTINHSRVTWGLDVEGHIRAHINSLMRDDGKIDKILRKASGPLNLVTTLFVGLFIINEAIDWSHHYFSPTLGNPSGVTSSDVIAFYLQDGFITKFIVSSLVLSISFFILFSALISKLSKSIRKPMPSFICLSDADETKKTDKMRIYNRRWISFASLLIMNTIAGVFATGIHNFVF